MITKVRHLLVLALAVSLLTPGASHTALAATYGSGNYGACAYQSGCPASFTTANAPNTGLQHTSILWPTIAGIVGFSVISFVVIRYINRGRQTG